MRHSLQSRSLRALHLASFALLAWLAVVAAAHAQKPLPPPPAVMVDAAANRSAGTPTVNGANLVANVVTLEDATDFDNARAYVNFLCE